METKEMANKIVQNTEKIYAPIIGLEKWRKDHGLVSPEMDAYIEAVQNQKAILVIAILLMTIIVNYLRYGVP